MQPIVTLTGGNNSLIDEHSQTLDFEDTIFTYAPRSSDGSLIWGGFLGEEYAFNPLWRWQFGLAYYRIERTTIRGEETQAPACNANAINFWNYQYQLSSQQFLLENKWLFTVSDHYHPYFLIGLGASFNRAYGFQVTAQNSGEVATAIFSDNNNTAFVYVLGLGMDVDVFNKLRIGVGYRFVDLGSYRLGTGTLDTGLGGEVFAIPALRLKTSFNQEFLAQLTYVI